MRPHSAVVLVALGVFGCAGASGTVHVPVCPTSGEALLDGKSAAGAMLVFHPVTPVELPALPRATVGKDGHFQVGTYGADDGLPEGEYVVTVLWTTKPRDADETVEGKSVVNANFSQKQTSPLKVVVVKGGDGNCVLPTFKLTR